MVENIIYLSIKISTLYVYIKELKVKQNTKTIIKIHITKRALRLYQVTKNKSRNTPKIIEIPKTGELYVYIK